MNDTIIHGRSVYFSSFKYGYACISIADHEILGWLQDFTHGWTFEQDKDVLLSIEHMQDITKFMGNLKCKI